jgi:phage gpG-like protein
MNQGQAKKILQLQQLWQRKQSYVMKMLGNEAVNFFKENFRLQGFKDNGIVEKWKERRYNKGNKQRAILIDRGTLVRSIHVKTVTDDTAVIGIGQEAVAYGAIHNAGGVIIPTLKMRRFFWAMYKKEIAKIPVNKNGTMSIAKGQAVNKAASMWKAMALAKKITIPQRKFMGSSTDLDAAVLRTLAAEIERILKVK